MEQDDRRMVYSEEIERDRGREDDETAFPGKQITILTVWPHFE